MDNVTAEYSLAPDDIIAFKRYVRHHYPDGRRKPRIDLIVFNIIPFFFAALLVSMLYRAFTESRPENEPQPLAAIFFVVLMLLGTLVYIYRRFFVSSGVKRQFRAAPPDSPLTIPRLLVISDEAVSVVLRGISWVKFC